MYYADMIPGGYGIAALLYAYTAYNRTIRYWTTRSQSVTHETRNTRRAESAHTAVALIAWLEPSSLQS